MGLQDFVGYLGSLMMFSTFWMRTMIPLRAVAIAANISMVGYAYLADLLPILIMQALMLPVNVYRLIQMKKLSSRVKHKSDGAFRIDALFPFMKKEVHKDGDVLFRAGDESDKMYFIRKGRIELEEVDRVLEAGELFGEIGVVSPHNLRTATAVCKGDAVLLAITQDEVLQLFYQQPEFGVYLIQLVTQRLLHNLEVATKATPKPA